MNNPQTTSNSHHKLAQAVQDAALLNINDDIQSIHDNLERIVIEIPEQAKQQVSSLREEILSLEQYLRHLSS